MDLTPQVTNYQIDDNSWLGSAHGTDETESITLDLSTGGFVAGTHYPNGFIPSGTALGKITATGLYGVYDNAAVDGRETLDGYLYGGVKVNTGSTKAGGALLVHGSVKTSKLPFQSGTGSVDAAGETDVAGRIRHRTA